MRLKISQQIQRLLRWIAGELLLEAERIQRAREGFVRKSTEQWVRDVEGRDG